MIVFNFVRTEMSGSDFLITNFDACYPLMEYPSNSILAEIFVEFEILKSLTKRHFIKKFEPGHIVTFTHGDLKFINIGYASVMSSESLDVLKSILIKDTMGHDIFIVDCCLTQTGLDMLLKSLSSELDIKLKSSDELKKLKKEVYA